MAKFRKKPIEIEAVQWFKTGDHKEVKVVGINRYNEDGTMLLMVHCTRAFIQTLEGEMTVTPGDWIITGIKGEVYPCKPDIFEATYDVVAETIVDKNEMIMNENTDEKTYGTTQIRGWVEDNKGNAFFMRDGKVVKVPDIWGDPSKQLSSDN